MIHVKTSVMAEDFEPLFEDSEFITCEPHHPEDPCENIDFGPGPDDEFTTSMILMMKTLKHSLKMNSLNVTQKMAASVLHQLTSYMITFDALRDRRGAADHGVDEFFVNVSPSNVLYLSNLLEMIFSLTEEMSLSSETMP